MKLFSDSFLDGGALPASGNPQLSWSEVPAGVGSLALLCMDADAPADFFLWSVVDMPPAMSSIAAAHRLPLRQGVNDYHAVGYHGPLPPLNGTHRYIFRLYALDVPQLALPQRFTGADVLDAMYGHIVDEAQLIGTYTRTW